uniref:HYDIN/VesB/CFA65-like Ig-like domain-containing protein n=1 Tax=Clastoptera arizonana TaxID=38151 RepID=A0A1B6DC25_9HEMI
MMNKKSTLEVIPNHIHIEFDPFKIKPITKQIKIYNYLDKKQRISISHPRTSYFLINGFKSAWIFPGIALSFSIAFHGDISRTYSDCFNVTSDIEDLTIEITAVPSFKGLINNINLPKEINFGNVQLGKTMKFKFTLLPLSNKELTFLFIFTKLNADCQIHPKKGKVENNKPLDVEINYLPTAYVTLNTSVQLFMPEVSATPYYIKIYATTKPGYVSNTETLDPPKISPITNIKKKKQQRKTKTKNEIKEKLNVNVKNLTIHDTNLMLIRKSKSVKSKDSSLLGPFGREPTEDLARKRNIESNFQKTVDTLKKENEKSLFHCRTKLVESNITQDFVKEIIEERTTNWLELKDCLDLDSQINQTQYLQQRPIRHINRVLNVSFSSVFSNVWFVRFERQKKFIEVIRKIIIYNRLTKRLEALKKLPYERNKSE